jgi:hypothetical protein
MGLHSHQVHRSRPNSSAVYVRHRPETTLLYQIVQEYWPEFQAELASQPAVMGKVLGIVYRAIATHLTRKAGYTKATARTGAVTLIQCFGGALNAHIHFHMLFLDGVYADNKHGTSGFHRLKAPTNDELIQLTHTIAHRVGRYLERQGLLVRDSDQSYLTADAVEKVRPPDGREAGLGHADNETPMNHLLGSSITYRIAVGPQQGRKVFTLQTLPDCEDDQFTSRVGNVAGFSLHAGVAARAHDRDKLERLCRYIARPAVSAKRLSMTRNGQVRYELKTPWRNGTTHVIFEPLDFISRLVALIPKPRVNLTRFHGVFAPNSKHRAQVTPAKRGKVKNPRSLDEDQTPAECRAAMTWAQRLKRVFGIDIETCAECGGDVKIIACIEDPAVIQKILAHLDDRASPAGLSLLPECRAPPATQRGCLTERTRPEKLPAY